MPAFISMSTRGEMCYPFDSTDTWQASEGLSLPPSLAEADSGEVGHGSQLLPVSWQSLHHDQSLNDLGLEPSVIALVDAVQLAELLGTLIDLVASADTDTQLSTILCQSPVCFRFWLGLSSGQAALHCNEAASGLLLLVYVFCYPRLAGWRRHP